MYLTPGIKFGNIWPFPFASELSCWKYKFEVTTLIFATFFFMWKPDLTLLGRTVRQKASGKNKNKQKNTNKQTQETTNHNYFWVVAHPAKDL